MEAPSVPFTEQTEIVRRVEALPGVQAAFASNFVPIGGGGGGARVLVEGRSVERGKEPIVGFVAALYNRFTTERLA